RLWRHRRQYWLLHVFVHQGRGNQDVTSALQLHIRERGRELDDRGPSFIGDARSPSVGRAEVRTTHCGALATAENLQAAWPSRNERGMKSPLELCKFDRVPLGNRARVTRRSSREREVAGDAVAVGELAQGRFAGGVGAHRGAARRLVHGTAGREATAVPGALEVEDAPGGGGACDLLAALLDQ